LAECERNKVSGMQPEVCERIPAGMESLKIGKRSLRKTKVFPNGLRMQSQARTSFYGFQRIRQVSWHRNRTEYASSFLAYTERDCERNRKTKNTEICLVTIIYLTIPM